MKSIWFQILSLGVITWTLNPKGGFGKEWKIGRDENDKTTTISSISHLLKDGDVISIYGPEGLGDCMIPPLNVNISIRGVDGCCAQIKSICDAETSQTYKIQNNRPLLHFSNPNGGVLSVKIEHIEFVDGFILAQNVNLQIVNCIFNQSTIRFMGNKETLSFVNGQYKIEGEKRNWEMAMEYTECQYGALNITNTLWQKTMTVGPTSITEATGLREDIIMKCSKLHVHLKSNDFGNRRLHILAEDDITLNAIELTFEGLNFSEKKVGGMSILIPSFCKKCHIGIKKSNFTNLIPEDIFFGRLFSRDARIAPIALFTMASDPKKDMTNSSILIAHNNFTGNQRAILIDKITMPIIIHSCLFQSNRVVVQGGAIISKGQNVTINKCSFISNEAGSIDSYKVKSGELMLYDLGKYVEFHSTENTVHHHFSNSSNETVIRTFGQAGGGGAIYVEDGIILVSHCVFEGNIAYDSGGGIYLSNSAKGKITDSNFTNSLDISSTLEGYLIFSVGESLILNNVNLNVNLTPDNDVDSSALFYFGRRRKCDIESLYMKCPRNFKIEPFNSTSEAMSMHNMTKIFDTLYYSCQKCDERYNLEGGWLRIHQKPDHITVFESYMGDCKTCPFGGNCSLSITAKPSFWGAQQKRQVKFYRCPKYYCCSNLDCPTYDTCTGNRNGRLCGKCSEGFTQTLFSAKCVPQQICRSYYIMGMAGFLGVAYTLFLMFQKDITNWLMSSPVKTHSKYRSQNIKSMAINSREVMNTISGVVVREENEIAGREVAANNSLNETAKKQTERKGDEKDKDGTKSNGSGSFLVILFYYFQDASIIKINTIYVDSEKYLENIETIVSEIFRFRFNFFSLIASELCIFPGMTTVQRDLLLAIFAPLLLLISFLIYLIFSSLYQRTKKGCLNGLAMRALSALILGLLFSYQRLATTSMSFLYCVPVVGLKVLYLDGTVHCYELWQYVTMAYVIICIIPFSMHLAVAPAFLERGWINMPEFVLASIIPLPFLISWTIRFRTQKKKYKIKKTPEIETIIAILQSPYRHFSLPGILKSFCWSGMIMGRRLILIISRTFITNVLFSTTVAAITCFLAILQQVEVKPYKDTLTNVAGTLSAGALIIVSLINLIRAAFEAAEYIPTGPVLSFVRQIDIMESLVLVWIPLVGLAILAVAFCLRFFMKMIIYPILRCTRK